MDPVSSPENQPPMPTQPNSSMASSFSLGRIVLISFGVLGLGLAIAFGGYYYGQMNATKQAVLYPSPTTPPVSPTAPVASPTGAMKNTTKYTNTAYGYSLEYPKNLQLQGQGLQVTDTTAPDVMITTDVTKASPDPKRVFFIRVLDKTLLTVNNKPISSYTAYDLATMDLAANVNNKNIYVATLSPVTKLQPLPTGVTDGYTFSVRSKGYETVSGGALWDIGDYVITEFDTPKYQYVLVYTNSSEMIQTAISFRLIK